MRIRRLLTVGATSALLMVLPASAALAHECFIASRSDAGNAGAANSPNWSEPIMIADAFAMFFGLEGEDLTEAVALAEERGLPTSVSFFEHHTLGANPKTYEFTPGTLKNGADNKGVDIVWFEGGLEAQLAEIAAEVTAA